VPISKHDCKHRFISEAYEELNLHRIWKIVKYYATGEGSESVYVQSMKLLQLQQDGSEGSYARYVKRFQESVRELILELLINTKFITGLDEEIFKDQLSRIHSMEEWPVYTELIPLLTRNATVTENINDLKKEIGTPFTAIKATSSGEKEKDSDDKVVEGQ
jgi:hypothetical protein